MIWDTAGEEKFDSMNKLYFRGAKAAFIVYDVSHEVSFERAKKWNGELEE